MSNRPAASAQRPRLAVALSLIFFLSGGASLLFETLWFRECGLVFGNGAWASAIVLASFMAGLAIGNLLAPKFRGEPLRIYAAMEITIGICGLLLVLLLPLLSSALAPLFRTLLDSPLLNAARLACAFVLLLIPATVMGATLPTLVRALSAHDPSFGRVLGLLYGCNTIGAVVGALAGELLLIRVLGVRGTGAFAGTCSVTAGLAALSLRSGGEAISPVRTAGIARPPRLLLAAGASGFALLALEVIWFRFVIFFVMSTSVAFAVMLAVVLAGIGMGALIASALWSRFPNADAMAPVVAAAAAATLVLCYSGFGSPPGPYKVATVFIDSFRLMLPVSILSGILFTVIGRAVERKIGIDAAALVTFANTVGAALGSLVAGFLLIPSLGVERSFFAIALLYAVIAALTIRADVPRLALAVAGVMAALALALFPFRLWANYFLPIATRAYRDSRIVAVREGVTETVVYLEKGVAGEPYTHKLFTNGFSMSGTAFPSRRYMSLFVYLPLALRPHARNALLISYGVGITAKRLTEARQLDSIDVVDISKSILDLSTIVWPGRANPLADPRVHAHIEDGRFFLLTTPRRFDLITAEPPPPKNAGIVNLYTREYFHLVHDRLSEIGIASYWLPAYQLSQSDNQAVIAAFCDAFEDCSLWSGAGAEWILLGSRGATATLDEEFARQWRDPVSGRELARIGLEMPEQLATTFLADAPILRRLTANASPLTDDHPLRLSPKLPIGIPDVVYQLVEHAPDAFAQSDFIRRVLPPRVRASAPAYFRAQYVLDRVMFVLLGMKSPRSPDLMRALLTQTLLRTLPRLVMGTDPWLEDIALRARARGDRDPYLAYVAAVGALSDRNYVQARNLFSEARRGLPRAQEIQRYESLAGSLAR